MNETEPTLQSKAELFDLWELVHIHADGVYDFDNTLTAEELKNELKEIITLESFGDN